MKQITLKTPASTLGPVCYGRMLATWGLYGCAIALLWHLAGTSAWAQAATWVVALAGGALLLGMEGS